MPILNYTDHKTLRGRGVLVLIYSSLIVGGLTMVYPFLVTFTGSLSNPFDYERRSPLPRFLWSREDRFMRTLCTYFPPGHRQAIRQLRAYFPDLPADKVKGIRVARQGFHDYERGSLIEGTDPRGRPYYWFGLEEMEHTLDHGSDLEAVADGYVAVTPLQLDFTHYAALGALADRFSD